MIRKSKPLSRRTFLEGAGAMGALIRLPLPPLIAMFNGSGTAYAATEATRPAAAIPTRFVYWFNGNGIPERYWIPLEKGADYTMTPCLSPLGTVSRRYPCCLRVGQSERALGWRGQRASAFDERACFRREVHGSRSRRTLS